MALPRRRRCEAAHNITTAIRSAIPYGRSCAHLNAKPSRSREFGSRHPRRTEGHGGSSTAEIADATIATAEANRCPAELRGSCRRRLHVEATLRLDVCQRRHAVSSPGLQRPFLLDGIRLNSRLNGIIVATPRS